MDEHQKYISSSDRAAVIVTGAEICYKKDEPVLSGLEMNVPYCSMYGLLGSSGCGKTTLLSCILGQRKLDRGEIKIFGQNPGTIGLGIPGRNVGYMPQDISLCLEFSILETLSYFGGLAGMEKKRIVSETKFLVELLDLPDASRQIATLSGGQQRRVSLAAALIHDPKLLILDEPTVGVDPLLGRRMWEHLRMCVVQKHATVIITSHYIEECRHADRIGLIRDGRLLIENSPTQLFKQHGCNNLERIILKMCKAGITPTAVSNDYGLEMHEIDGNVINSLQAVPAVTENPVIEHDTQIQYGHEPAGKDSPFRMWALVRKNVTIVIRNPLLLFFTVISPIILLSLMFLALGTKPVDLGVGILNHEMKNRSMTCQNATVVSGECGDVPLSCQFLHSIPSTVFKMKLFESEEDAIQAVKMATIWGYITIPPDFSDSLFKRISLGSEVDDLTLNASRITLRLDETNAQVSLAIKLALHKAFYDFLSIVLPGCGIDSRVVEFPLKYRGPIFGSDDIDFRQYLLGGVPVAVLLLYACFTTAIRVIGEKKSGVQSRSLVSGVRMWEILVAHLLTKIFVLLTQSVFAYFLIRVIFGIPILGSHLLVIIIFLLSAYSGTAAGYLMGTLLNEEFHAAVISIAIFFPTYFVSGILWPVEGMILGLRYISPYTPSTLSGEAVRSIISRGWGFTHPHVWPGVIIPVGYIGAYIILICACNRFIQK